MKKSVIFLSAVFAAVCARAQTNTRYVVQVDDAGRTIPPGSVATPQQVSGVRAEAAAAYEASTGMLARATAAAERVRLYSTNYVVTSTVYVQSIGGVPYDADNQVVRIHGVAVDADEVKVTASVRQAPLVPPALDWRATLAGGSNAWENIAATVAEVAVPPGAADAVKAYEFTLPRPDSGGSAFFRVVDNSSGTSGSGLWWVVFGGINVDGRQGYSGTVEGHTFVGGVLVEPEPLGGL